MVIGQWILLTYAVFMTLGGVMGARAGSKVSLYAGVGSGVALLVAFGLTYVSLGLGLWSGCVLAAILCLVFASRLVKTGKMMPTGLLLLVSILAAVLLGFSARVADATII